MSSKSAALCCTIVELRQYTMKPGLRDDLVSLFEREFVESQEAVGARVIGTFRDLDDPDRFVWLRGFEDMEAREQALSAFYFGPVWQAHREAANATLLDNDDFLLLTPPAAHAGFDLPASRAPVGTEGPAKGMIVANLWRIADADEVGFAARFETDLAPLLAASGSAPVAWLTVEHSPNTFPRLPVREGEHLLVWFAAYQDAAEHATAVAALQRSAAWTAAYQQVSQRLLEPSAALRLEPTARSLLRV